MPLLSNARPGAGRLGDSMPLGLPALGFRRRFPSGAILFQQEAPADSCFFLEEGEIALRRISRSGTEVELSRIGEGQWFGEIILFASQVYPAQAVAVSDCVVLEFKRSAILSSPDPAVSSFFLGLLARKCLTLNHRIEELTIMDARERLSRFIVALCPGHARGCCGGRSNCSFPLPKKKREIALELGMAPETLSRAFRQMEEEGYIKVSGSRLEVPSCERLMSLIERD